MAEKIGYMKDWEGGRLDGRQDKSTSNKKVDADGILDGGGLSPLDGQDDGLDSGQMGNEMV